MPEFLRSPQRIGRNEIAYVNRACGSALGVLMLKIVIRRDPELEDFSFDSQFLVPKIT